MSALLSVAGRKIYPLGTSFDVRRAAGDEEPNVAMSEDLECPICLQEYDLADKQPRMLLCSGSHELCAGCVSMLDITGGSWTCPQCRESVRATSNPNRSLMAALELHARVKEHTEELKAEAAKLEAAVAEGEPQSGGVEQQRSNVQGRGRPRQPRPQHGGRPCRGLCRPSPFCSSRLSSSG